MDNPKFKELFSKLNPEQKLAVESIEGPVMVIAGPGTGKTQTLTLRIANILLKTQVNPENILALTFTDSGVTEMRKRLVSIIGTPAYRVTIHTFHGFCHRLIQENPEDFKELMSANNITELDQIELMEKVITDLDLTELKPFVDPLYYTKPALSAIDELKKEGVTIKDFHKAVEKQEKGFEKIEDLYYEKGKYKGKMKGKYLSLQKRIRKNKELAIIYESYDKELRKLKLFDFNDMLLFVIKKMQSDEEFLLRIQEQYHYFLVDEHQDTNAAQNKIIELLASYFDNPNLFVVGDEKQAIFRFQGASLENFLYFKRLYPDALLINLKKNYRSNQAILEAATSLISNNTKVEIIQGYEMSLVSETNLPEEKVNISEFSLIDSEYHSVANDIEEKIKAGTVPSDIAILARKNRTLSPFSNIFDAKKIPYVYESEQNIIEDINIQKFLLLLKAVSDLGKDELLVQVMHLDFLSMSPLDIYKIRRLSIKEDLTMWQILEEGKHNELTLRSKEKIDSFVSSAQIWKKLIENEPADIVFIELLNDSNLLASIMNKKNGLEILEKFSRLFEEIKQRIIKDPAWSTNDFLKYIDLLQKHNISLRKPQSVKREGVRVMTAHRAKGLEFDYVYIVAASDNNWGNTKGRASLFTLPWEYMKRLDDNEIRGDEIEDERRLFYVALTRARKSVSISYSLFDEEGKDLIPSRFVEEIAENFRQSITTSTFEKDFSKNKHILFTPKQKRSSKDIENEYLESKEFFKELFIHRGLSVSALNNYLDCPWRYFFRNLLTLPEIKSDHQRYGTAMHRTLNRYIINRSKRVTNEKELLEIFYEMIQDEAFDVRSEIKWKHRGETALEGYYKEKASNWKKDIQSEKQIEGVRLSENVILNGKLDMIEPIDSKKVRVYDFKTGKPKSRNEIEGKTKNSNGNYKRQLVFYKILFDRYNDRKIIMEEGVMDFVEPNEKGIYKMEIFTITDQEVKELEDTIIKVAGEILTLDFWNKRCDKAICEYCQLRDFIGTETP